jgi:hypothetical protein
MSELTRVSSNAGQRVQIRPRGPPPHWPTAPVGDHAERPDQAAVARPRHPRRPSVKLPTFEIIAAVRRPATCPPHRVAETLLHPPVVSQSLGQLTRLGDRFFQEPVGIDPGLSGELGRTNRKPGILPSW